MMLIKRYVGEEFSVYCQYNIGENSNVCVDFRQHTISPPSPSFFTDIRKPEQFFGAEMCKNRTHSTCQVLE